MPLWLLYLLLALTTARLTRLLVEDKVSEPFRNRMDDWLDPREAPKKPNEVGKRIRPEKGFALIAYRAGRAFLYLITCSWCTSVWLAPVIVFATAQFTSVPLPWLAAAISSYATGWLASAHGWGESRWELTRRQVVIADVEQKKVAPHLTFDEEED